MPFIIAMKSLRLFLYPYSFSLVFQRNCIRYKQILFQPFIKLLKKTENRTIYMEKKPELMKIQYNPISKRN